MEKKYDHLLAEPQAQQLWAEQNVYAAHQNPGKIYSVDTPPPTVSGSLHIGHIFSYTQTDIIARYKRMSGYSVFYPFGFDDNGLPTERFVEKAHNIGAHTLTRSAFIDLCLQETVKVEEQFKNLWQRIGLSVDWSLCYSTIDKNTRKISQASFIELLKKDFVYRKNEPALYCTACRTTVAQAELDDAEKASQFNTIKFQTTDGEELFIATTRPELLPSCVTLFYHPDDCRYQHLKNKQAIVPIFGQKITILEDTDVDPAKGTGLVMCCTFGDKTDISWYKKYHLKYKQSIGRDGKFTQDAGPLAGLSVLAAREKVLTLLKEQNYITEQKAITHSVNIHDRCKREIEYLVLPQWFLKILPYKQNFIELGEQINWYPSFMKSRYKNWVENLNWDWCLSRQRFYGIPFPVWHCTNCAEIIVPKLEELPIDPQEMGYNKPCSQCAQNNIVPDTDVMDTWNTSSITPYICLSLYTKNNNTLFSEPTDFLPMSMRPQAHDIIRTWAFYTIVKSWMHNAQIPWKDIVISGHVLSSQKDKISKSQGNSPLSPENLLTNYSADAIRYWTASGTLGHDIAFSETQLAIGQRLLVKLWNAFRFAQPYLETFSAQADAPKNVGAVNEWILHSASITYKNYTNYFEQQEFSLALDSIEKFFWQNFCDNYLEFIKDQLTNPDKYSAEHVQATLWTLYTVGLRILQLYSPFVPHITETLYQSLYKKHVKAISIHQTRYNQTQLELSFPESDSLMQIILDLTAQVRKIKSENQLSLKTDLVLLTLNNRNNVILDSLKQQELLIMGVTRALKITYAVDGNEATSLSQNTEGWQAVINTNSQARETV